MTKEQVVFWLLLLRFNPDNNVLPNEVIDIAIGAVVAQPERRKGKWVPLICTSDEKHHEWCGYQCSICRERTPRLMQYNFCPRCGADMRGEQDE